MPIGIEAEICFSREVFFAFLFVPLDLFGNVCPFPRVIVGRWMDGAQMDEYPIQPVNILGVFHQGGDQATLKQSAKCTGMAVITEALRPFWPSFFSGADCLQR